MTGSTTFIAPGDFTEGIDDAAHRPKRPPAQSIGFSTFEGLVVFANVDRRTLEALLPTGLALASNGKHPGLHPVLHIAGQQSNTGAEEGGVTFPGVDYREFILLVPFVLHDNSSQWHNFVVRMYLDNEIAKEIGKLFAYRKLTGFTDLTVGSIVRIGVMDEAGNQLFLSQDPRIRGGFSGSAADALARLPNFPDIVRILGMPMLGVDPKTEARECSYFDLGFDKATITAITSEFQYFKDFRPPQLAPDLRTSVADGAIRVEGVSWRLQFPPGECEDPVQAPVDAGAKERVETSCRSCSRPLPTDARFCPQCGVAVDAAASTAATKAQGQDGERRQTSVVFVDLIGSTTLASTMDPEALRQLLRQFRSIIERVVEPHRGMIAQYFGDGILIFFGYPEAREDAAEDAVSAALDIVRGVRADDASGRLRVRVGVATGIVVSVAEGNKPFSLGDVAVGGPPWLAARLQGVAPVDGVVIANGTWELAGHLFECQPLGRQALRGYSEGVPAWLVLGQRRSAGRFAARWAARGPGPIVGRDAEVQVLVDTWNEARQNGRGALVQIVGEAGIGKSRLVEALHEHIAGDPFMALQYHCAARFRNTALYPVIAQLERAAGLEREDSPEVKLTKLEAMLARSVAGEALATSVAYIASLLSVPCGPPYPLLPELPDRRKEGLLATLEHHLGALASGEPVLLLVEDWHWADPSTQVLLQRISRVIAERPVMAVLTSRAEFAPEWPAVAPVVIRLGRLTDEDCAPLIAHVAGHRPLPAGVVRQVLRKSEGVPLYVEEITKALIDAGVSSDSAADDPAASPSGAVPGTLRDLMQSRLDSLARAKDVAQLGAAVGREFGYGLMRALQASESDLLRSLHMSSETDLRAALESLVNADVVQRHGSYPEARFTFRHALIQDAAYETMLLGVRPGIHLEIATALLASDPAIAEIRPELLAHHFSEAGCLREAGDYFYQAGMRAASRGANLEPGEHFRAALRCFATLPESTERHERELFARVELGLTVTAIKGYAAAEVSEVYERARHLCSLLGNYAALFPVLRGLCTYYMMRAEFATALELATECLRIGDETGRPDQRIEAMAALGYTLVYLGRLVEGRSRLEDAVATYHATEDECASWPTVKHGVMASLALTAIVAWMQGEHNYAARCSQKSIALAEGTGRPFDLAYACCFAAMLANFRGDIASAIENADRGIACATEHAFKDWLMAGKAQRAIAGILRGEAPQSRATLEATATQWQASGAELNRHVIIAGHAAATLANFNVAGALTRVDEAVAHGERFQERWLDAEMHRLRGMILEYTPNSSAAAADAYRRAVQIANGQRAPYLALRSAVRLWACDKNAKRTTDAAEIVKDIIAILPEDARQTAEFAAAQKLLASEL